MNKAAKEMFEELGYELDKEHDNLRQICYTKENEHFEVDLIIDIDQKYILKEEEFETSIPINFNEWKAINKQIEELGWLNDEV